MAKKKEVKKSRKKQSIEFADGKNHLIEESKEAQSLEAILGFKEKNPFGVNSALELESLVEKMSLTELQELAVKTEVFPSGTKLTLKNKILKAFSQYTNGGSSKVVQVTKPILDPSSSRGKDLLKLIKEQS
jgi:hypothetical protein